MAEDRLRSERRKRYATLSPPGVEFAPEGQAASDGPLKAGLPRAPSFWRKGPVLAGLFLFGCGQGDQPAESTAEHAAPNTGAVQEVENLSEGVEVPPPPFSAGIFPCSNCHGMMPVNRERRDLTIFHTDIVLHHDEDNRWCLDCHDAENRDQLHLASGAPVPFEESYRLCGQCHGEKYRDWRAGVHGRRSGRWDGHKTYLLCAHCHNPHSPRFQPIEPKPAPVRPSRTGGGEGSP